MRRLFFLLVLATLGWWGYGWANGAEASRDGKPVPPGGAQSTPTAPLDAPLTNMLSVGQDQQVQKHSPEPDAEPPPAAPVMPGLAELLPRINQREPAAVSLGWVAVATQAGTPPPELLAALAAPGKDFASQLQALGADNSFLHSAEGRALAASALAAAMALPDAEAVAAGSQLINLSLRGRIDRAHTQARACVDEAYRKHRVRADRWVCDPGNVAGSRSYTIGDGDTLGKVASKFRREKIPVESGTLAVLNRIHNENAVQVGQKIKVPVDPIHAVVEKRSFSLAVYVGDSLLRLYWIGHGEHDKTPVADFTVGDKQPRPQWTAPNGEVYAYGDPRNILGEYFIKFRHASYTGFGAHGTPMPDTICTMSSMGCIRMLAPDIQELFKILPRDAHISVRATESLR
ncbi:MAG TPA: L,D-transpeptidase family protein [Planctomycetota bacterium]|nr:L,D-transpeptidase family protein [Planctomycetota bacterium]